MNFHHPRCCLVLALSGLVFSTGGVLLQEPLLSSYLKGSENISVIILVYAYLFLLNPLTIYLNILSGAPGAPIPVVLLNHLPRAAHVVSFATLLLGLPLWIQASISEESIGFAIGAALLCLGLVTTLTSVFKKLLISSSNAGRGFVLASFSLCISTGFLIFFDPILSFSYKIQYDPLFQIGLHYFLLFVIFFIFILGITLLIIRTSAPAAGRQTGIEAEHLAIVAMSVAYAILLVGVYMMAITDMAAVGVEAAE